MVEIEVGPNLAAFSAFVLSWHGFFSFIAVATAVFLVGRWAPLRGIHPDDIYSIAIWAIIGGIVGARVVHVIDHWSFYQNTPGQIIAIWSGGIGIWGGILGGFIGGVLYSLWRKHPVGSHSGLNCTRPFACTNDRTSRRHRQRRTLCQCVGLRTGIRMAESGFRRGTMR